MTEQPEREEKSVTEPTKQEIFRSVETRVSFIARKSIKELKPYENPEEDGSTKLEGILNHFFCFHLSSIKELTGNIKP